MYLSKVYLEILCYVTIDLEWNTEKPTPGKSQRKGTMDRILQRSWNVKAGNTDLQVESHTVQSFQRTSYYINSERRETSTEPNGYQDVSELEQNSQLSHFIVTAGKLAPATMRRTRVNVISGLRIQRGKSEAEAQGVVTPTMEQQVPPVIAVTTKQVSCQQSEVSGNTVFCVLAGRGAGLKQLQNKRCSLRASIVIDVGENYFDPNEDEAESFARSSRTKIHW
ncbi:hypothetical protein B0H14DRAFT_2629146 [Mycena olivaceomarginata]|nr:hypothetical protein B0H14DRAFT_2629146 [Mycena olivaceomarginata]